MDLRLLVRTSLRSLPIRFIGELLLLGLILVFVEFRIGERKTIDWRQHFRETRSERPIDKNLVIIKIDDYAFRSIPGGEVSREYLADLVKELKSYSPKVIGLDFLLTTHFNDRNDAIVKELKRLNPDYKDPDQKMKEALQSDIPVVLGADLIINDKQKLRLIQPMDTFLLENVFSGYTKVNLDKDNVCRDAYLFSNVSGKEYASFASQVLINTEYEMVPDYGPHTIAYYSPASTFSSFSSKDILEGKFRQVSEDWFRNKIILVGVTYTGSGDFFKTPLSGIFRNSEDMPGIYLHAMVIKNIMDQDYVPAQKKGYSLLVVVIMLLVLSAGVFSGKRTVFTLGFVVLAVIHTGLSFILFVRGVNLPLLLPLLIIIAGIFFLHLFCKIKEEYIYELNKNK